MATAPGSPKVTPARWSELTALLRDHKDDPVPAWASLVFDQAEMAYIEVDKRVPGTALRPRYSKLDEVGRGTNVDHIDQVLLDKWGPGDYRLAALAPCPANDNRTAYVGHTFPTLGDPKEIEKAERGAGPINAAGAERAAAAAAAASDGEPSAGQTMNRMLKERLERTQVRAAIREEEREEKREQVEPLRLATELIAAVKGAVPAGGGDNRILELLLQQNQAFLTALLNKPAGPAIAPGSDPLAALGLVTDLALKLGFSRGEGAVPGTDWASILPTVVNSPVVREGVGMLRDGLDLLRVKVLGEAGARPARVEGTAEVPREGIAGGGAAMTPEEQAAAEMAAANQVMLKDLVEIGVNALKSKDFETVDEVYETVRPLAGGLLREINPNSSPFVTLAVLKRFDTRFAALSVEWAAYYAWLREQNAPNAPPPAGANPRD